MKKPNKNFKNSILFVSEQTNLGKDFNIMLGNFLEDFYYFDTNIKIEMIREPPLNMNGYEQVPFLAATAHKLSNDYNLDVPKWVFDNRCYLPGNKPYFSCSTKGNLSLYFMFKSPAEFKHRNIFVCENVLMRV